MATAALHMASANGHQDVVQLLLNAGAASPSLVVKMLPCSIESQDQHFQTQDRYLQNRSCMLSLAGTVWICWTL